MQKPERLNGLTRKLEITRNREGGEEGGTVKSFTPTLV